MKRKPSVSIDKSWHVKDGWMSRKKCAKPSNTNTPKISSIRYAAMRNIQLPSEKNMKQTKIAFPVIKKSNKADDSSTSSLSKPSPQSDQHLPIKSVTISVDELTQCMVPCEDKENQSDLKHSQNEVSPCFVPSNYDDTSHMPDTPVPVQSDLASILPKTKMNYACSGMKIDRPMTTQPSTSCSDSSVYQDYCIETYEIMKLHNLQTNNTDHQVECCSAPGSSHYDVTMKFVSDSQGNQIFDRFTQKHSLDTSCQPDLLTDTEQELYNNFANGLLENKECQSTQMV